jgi:nitrogen-specific signal transduction histidine kinase
MVRPPVGDPVIVVNSRDMTDRRRLEAQLITSERMASMGMLAAGMAHEINNPLAAVIANLELATRHVESCVGSPDVPQDLRDELLDAREAAERLRAVAGDLRLFSRAEAETAGPVDVHTALESSARMAWNEIRHRARLAKSYGDLPPVLANESRLGQVFLNLLINAAQAIPEGRVEANLIRIVTRIGPAGTVVVEITDTGVGMTPDVRERLFEPFFTSKPPGVGTGLGLAICQRIIAAAKGRIEVESEAGTGSTFRVILPAAERSAPEVARADEVAAAIRRGRVLVIDDEHAIGRVIERMLGAAHDVIATTSAQEALDRLSAGEQFDVILCDLMMPRMTGSAFHAELERLTPGAGARVVFMTGGAFTPAARAFLDRVSNLRLAKPFDEDALHRVVAALVR